MSKIEYLNLNKEDFWNEMSEKYPKAVKDFCDWIDEFKVLVFWNDLFNSNSDYQDYNGKNAPAPKYHEVPIFIQYGVWLEYLSHKGVVSMSIDTEDLFLSLRNEITEFLQETESQLS